MDGSVAISQVQQAVSFRRGNADEILTALIQAQDYYEAEDRTLPWWLLMPEQELSLVAGTAFIALPTGFIKEDEDQRPYLYTPQSSTPVFLSKFPRDDARGQFAANTSNYPIAYSLGVSAITFWPTPRVSTTAYWGYYKKDTPPASSGENLWLRNAPYLLIARAAYIFAADVADKNAVEKLTARVVDEERKLLARIVAREQAARPYVMGRNH